MASPTHPDAPQGFNERLDLDLQYNCKYEFLITRNPLDSIESKSTLSSIVNVGANALGSVVDILVTRLYIDNIDFPGGISFEYERVNGNNYVKGVSYPDEVTMTFLEDEKGTVRRYLTEWIGSVAVPSVSNLGALASAVDATGISVAGNANVKEGTYTFKDNQEQAKRTGLLLMKNASESDFPLPGFDKYPRIMFYGLVIKANPTYSIGHEKTDHMAYNVLFSIDEIKIPLLI